MRKNLLLTFVAISLVSSAFLFGQKVDQKDYFTLWKEQFGKNFTPLEDTYRKIIFMSNLKMFA